MSKSKNILVVDDSRMSRMMIKAIIKTHFPDFEILEASGADEALSITENVTVDIITLDMNMPGMDGLTLGAKLRERFPDAGISLVTANVQAAIRQRAMEADIVFVPKPITEDHIKAYIESVA